MNDRQRFKSSIYSVVWIFIILILVYMACFLMMPDKTVMQVKSENLPSGVERFFDTVDGIKYVCWTMHGYGISCLERTMDVK